MSSISQSLNDQKESVGLKARLRHLAEMALSAQVGGSPAAKAKFEVEIANKLSKIIPQQGYVATFNGFKNEPQFNHFINAPNVVMVYPLVTGSTIQFFKPLHQGDFIANKWGILEPSPDRSVQIARNEIAAVLTPGVAFDRQLNRLGRGRGYYDRFLDGYQGIKIGVGFSSQVLNEEIPVEEHDQRLDFLVTEKYVLQRFEK